MIESIQQMPISEQLHWALTIAVVGGGIGVAMRELSRDREIKIAGRCLGFGAFFVMMSFAVHAAHKCESLSLSHHSKIVGRGVRLLADGEMDSRQSPSSFPAVNGFHGKPDSNPKTYQFTSKEGHTLKWSCSHDSISAPGILSGSSIEFHALRSGK